MRGSIQIRSVLDALEIYDTARPFLDAEVSAYEAGIQLFLDEVDRVFADLFVATATQAGLRERESLFRSWGAETEPEALRAQLAEREKIRPCFAGDLRERLAACGIQGELTENHEGGLLIRAGSLQGLDAAQALAEARQFLPAHLPVAWE